MTINCCQTLCLEKVEHRPPLEILAELRAIEQEILQGIRFARLSERRQQLSRKDSGPKRNAIIFSDDLLMGEASYCG